MKSYLFLAAITACLLGSLRCIAQDKTIETIVQEGIALHDTGEYAKAIQKYEEALILNNYSPLVNYEVSLTYFEMRDYPNALKYSRKVIKMKTEHMLEAYVVHGSALDMMGKTKESIKLYEKAIKAYPDNYLLSYNLAVSYANFNERDKAEKALIDALTKNPSHGSSHLLLSSLMQQKQNTIKSLLPLYVFLLVEPDSKRSADAYSKLKLHLQSGVSKTSDNSINIMVSLSQKEDDFQSAGLMMSLMGAANHLEKNKNKPEQELFIENNKSLFNLLGELKKDKKGFWWDFYVSFLYQIVQENHIEAFSYYISQSAEDKAIQEWLTVNKSKIESFKFWLEVNN